MSEPTLTSLVTQALDDLDGVTVRAVGGSREWQRASTVFVATDGDSVELRLDPAIAAAARRTPNTEASSRGREWVRFSPPILDDHALDRLEAWLELAYRRALRLLG